MAGLRSAGPIAPGFRLDNVLDTAGINDRLRWNPRADEDLYIVLNHESEATAAFSGFRARASEITV